MDAIATEQAQALAVRAGALVRFHHEGTKDWRCAQVSGSAFVGPDGRQWIWVVDQQKPGGTYRVPAREVETGCPDATAPVRPTVPAPGRG